MFVVAIFKGMTSINFYFNIISVNLTGRLILFVCMFISLENFISINKYYLCKLNMYVHKYVNKEIDVP